MEKITIDLKNSTDAIAYEKGNVIHLLEFEKTCRIIKDSIKYSFDQAEDSEILRNDTIGIFGDRGTGKTSFIKSVLRYFEKDSEYSNNIVEPLLIDPTMIEQKGHIFLTIIALIDNKVNEELKKEKHTLDERKSWKEIVTSLAYGIPTIDGVGGHGLMETDWQDPEYIMHRGLKNVTSAFYLSREFRNFINHALNILGKKIFLIAFDDIDVDFRKGWPILEMIRKYFTYHKVITIVSGDIKLFSLAVRKNKWETFGRDLLEYETKDSNFHSHFNDKVTQMENQYFLKVLKPERRIQLSALNQKLSLSESKYKYYVKYADKNKEINLLYREILEEFGIRNVYQSESYINFLLALPIRTQINFLTLFQNLEFKDRQAILMPFLSDLYEKDVKLEDLQNNPHLINAVILKLLINEKDLSGAYQLMPNTNDESRNISLFALNIFASSHVSSDAYQIFDYLIKIGYTRNLLSSFPYKQGEVMTVNYSVPSIDDLCVHSGIYQDKALRDIVGNINSYIKTFDNSTRSEHGIIHIETLSLKTKKGKEEDENRLDRILSNSSVSIIKETLGYLPFTISESSKSNKSFAIYSIFTLLGAIGELIRRNDSRDMNKAFTELSQVRTYIIPDSRAGSSKIGKTINLVESDRARKEGNIHEIIEAMENWINEYKNVKPSAIHLLGKISTRFFYALNSIEQRQSNKGLGFEMHRRVVALMNSVLYEDVMENVPFTGNLNNNNPVKEDTIFLSNLKEAISSNYPQNLSFSKWFLSCPILSCFLNENSDIFNLLRKYCNSENVLFGKKHSMYSLLELEKSRNQNKQLEKVKMRLSNNYVFNYLNERNISFKIFIKKGNRSDTQSQNILINQIIEKYFGIEWSAARIDYFRNYLIKNKII